MRKRIFNIIQIGNRDDWVSRGFDILLTFVIMLNVIVTFMETFDDLSELFDVFKVLEIVTVAFFCVEYVLRIITADYLYPNEGPVKSRLHFLVSFDGIVDKPRLSILNLWVNKMEKFLVPFLCIVFFIQILLVFHVR